ncbi:cytochrome P450 [Dimargaris cristalligena]|uniref:Cytochrome P450 n=1 Tax=Dimargaris cristalligena TaxID=215637 RepID=A0A4P9ZSY1_9FUNG|nr:cytochrome P450 [Dimargaris cristalligena]|eukprot:RKP35832.1 cytochrome P450 [Dimargaris cristalligena]
MTKLTDPLVEELVPEIVFMLAAGYDTAGNTLGFLFWQLFQHPVVFDRLVMDVTSQFSATGPTITLAEITDRLPYVEAVVYETMRCYPSLPSRLPRIIKGPARSYHGYYFPTNTLIHTPIYSVHRNSVVWSHPNTFDPDRFLGPEGEKRKRDVHGFNIGPHHCIGRR